MKSWLVDKKRQCEIKFFLQEESVLLNVAMSRYVFTRATLVCFRLFLLSTSVCVFSSLLRHPVECFAFDPMFCLTWALFCLYRSPQLHFVQRSWHRIKAAKWNLIHVPFSPHFFAPLITSLFKVLAPQKTSKKRFSEGILFSYLLLCELGWSPLWNVFKR